jgi:filamentous hemagglutinin
VLQDAYGGGPASFKTSDGTYRFVDNFSEGVARESKAGRISFGRSIRRQVAKDAELLKDGAVESVEWHFFKSPTTGKSGPTESLREALEEAGITIIIHGD